ncbi:hypothetical protein ACHAXH_000159 [Discostella pseudostelligera]
MATLSAVDIEDAGLANMVFDNDTSVIVARPGRRSCCAIFWFTIPDGFYALVTRHGAHVDCIDSTTGQASPVWPCGLHYGPPWLRVSHLVTKQDIVFNAKIHGCHTNDNVTVGIDLSIVLRVMGDDDPRNVVKFVHELTPLGLHAQLQGALETSMRTLVRSLDHTNVLGLRRVNNCTQLEASSEADGGTSAVDAMKFRLNQQFTTQGIEILNVVVKEITLPTRFQHQLLQKTLLSSQNDVHAMQHKQSMQSLIQEEEVKSLQQTHELEQRKLQKECEYDTMMANLKLRTLHAENARNIQSIETQMSIDVGLVTVENNLTVQRIADESKLETEKIRAQSKAHGELAKVESEVGVGVMLAKNEIEVAKNVAKTENTLRQARSLALATISEQHSDNNMIAFSPRNVMDFGMLLGGGGPMPCAPTRRGTQSLPDTRTLHRQRVLTIMAERNSGGRD